MNTEELPSDSDQSDGDYVPSDVEEKSEEESDDDISDGKEENHDAEKGKKRKKKSRKGRKLRKPCEEEEEEESDTPKIESSKSLSAEEEKKRADSLWADFMKDTGGSSKKVEVEVPAPRTINVTNSSQSQGSSVEKAPLEKIEEKNDKGKENTVKITEIFQFAGEEVRIEKEVPRESTVVKNTPGAKLPVPRASRGGGRSSGGLASVLGQLGKKPKLSVLEKTKLDWTEFKKEEGIEEELQTHNKGKDGYLEKQDFLQRADLRQFEIEKQLRTSNKRGFL